jgi:ATP-dependent helicase/nuclease subunit A
VAPVAAARQAALAEAEDEYRRLLYVAMTRAADRLIIGGADGERSRPKGCWYDLVVEPLRPFLIEDGDESDKVWRFQTEPPAATVAAPPAMTKAQTAPAPIFPPWLQQPLAATAEHSVPVVPSAAFAEDFGATAHVRASPAERRKALARGRIVHRLMQSLPDIPEAARKAAIERYLKNAASDFTSAEQAEMAQRVLVILNDLIFADLFAPGSRAEVPIVGRIARAGAPALGVSGQVDRLAVSRDTVLIADYKTDRAIPTQAADVPEPYTGQLALYRAVLARIYPGKTIRTALIFTEGPTVIEVPDATLDAALSKALAR